MGFLKKKTADVMEAEHAPAATETKKTDTSDTSTPDIILTTNYYTGKAAKDINDEVPHHDVMERKGIQKVDIPMILLFGCHVIMICLYAGFVDYGTATAPGNSVSTYYSFYSDVAVMIFIGFGYLMTFLKRHMHTAVGFTFLVSVFVFEYAILTNGLFEQIHEAQEGHSMSKIYLTMPMLIEGLFAAGAVLISFGALIGKVSPEQLILMAIIEIPVYSLNYYIGARTLQAVDIGGSIFVHMFGAYFGLACSVFASPKPSKSHPQNGSRHTSDTFAMIGSVFLFIYWPSFNGALAPSTTQFRVIINSTLSLASSCVSAFVFSRLLRSTSRRFDMVDIQNATLAGGVAVGASADMVLRPAGAMGIGTIAGILSVVGYVYVTPLLEKIGIHDTCGVNNLHGMPALLAASAGVITCGIAYENQGWYDGEYSNIFLRGQWQSFYQMAAACITMVLAISTGLLAGALIRLVPGPMKPVSEGSMYYEDEAYWHSEEASTEIADDGPKKV